MTEQNARRAAIDPPKSSHWKSARILAALAAAVAVLRYFMKGWMGPLGVPTFVGSTLSSVTVILIVGLVLRFFKEGRATEGRYLRAAAWFAGLAAWCELLVIGGILATERSGADTYYSGPWELVIETFPTGRAHAIGHTQGFVPRTLIWLLVGGVIYWSAKRSRRRKARR